MTGLFIEFFLIDVDNKMKDITKVVILFVIYLYYFLIILSYFFISLYLIIKLIIFSIKKNKEEGNNNKKCDAFKNIIKNGFYLNLFFEEENIEIPNINLINYAINPFLDKYYKFKNKKGKEKVDKYYKNCLFIRIALIFFSLIIFIIIFASLYKIHLLSIFLFIFAFCVFSLFSIIMNFPCFWRSRKTYCDFFGEEVRFNYHFKHSTMISFIRFINDLIIFIVMGFIIGWHLYQSIFKNKTPQKIEDFPYFDISQKKYNTKDLLLSNLCYNSVYNIPISLYIPIINDAYYYNDKIKISPGFYSSLHVKNYRNLFFDDDNYEIDVKGLITKENSNVKMIQYDVKNLKNEITILSIRGTFVSKDAFMDVQLYFPSVFLNILSSFSLFNKKKNSLSFRFIEYSLSIPYRIFFQYLIVENYLNELLDAYYENDKNKKFKKNVVIVGHSLGGGLAKILGKLVKRQAISLSGPGINAFHSLWGYEGNSENFDVSVIDLIPDFDLVPRVEISGGTIHRIICKAGVFACHGKERSLCEVLIMCRNPSYELYCKNMAKLNDKEINEILKSSELNKNK